MESTEQQEHLWVERRRNYAKGETKQVLGKILTPTAKDDD